MQYNTIMQCSTHRMDDLLHIIRGTRIGRDDYVQRVHGAIASVLRLTHRRILLVGERQEVEERPHVAQRLDVVL